MKNKKFIVWDWNGTLFDDTHIVLDAFNALLARRGHRQIDIEELREKRTTPHNPRSFYQAIGLSAEEAEIFFQDIKRDFQHVYLPLAADADLRDGAVEILAALKKNSVPNVIVSNHLEHHIVELLAQYGLTDCFGAILAYAQDSHFTGLPKGERLKRYLQEQGFAPQNGLTIGDTTEEIETASELGLSSVALTGGIYAEHRLKAAKPDYVIHSLHDLLPILEERGFMQ